MMYKYHSLWRLSDTSGELNRSIDVYFFQDFETDESQWPISKYVEKYEAKWQVHIVWQSKIPNDQIRKYADNLFFNL